MLPKSTLLTLASVQRTYPIILHSRTISCAECCDHAQLFAWFVLATSWDPVLLNIANIYEVAGNSGRRSHCRADQMCASTTSLAALEITIARRGAALALFQGIAIHSDTHATAGLAPFKASLTENVGNALFFRHTPHSHRTWHDHSSHFRRNMLALYILSCHAQNFQARIGTGANEDRIQGNLCDLLTWLQTHILQCALVCLPF